MLSVHNIVPLRCVCVCLCVDRKQAGEREGEQTCCGAPGNHSGLQAEGLIRRLAIHQDK